MKIIDISDLQNSRPQPGDGWYHFTIVGQWPGTITKRDENGKEITRKYIQHIDQGAVRHICEAGLPPEGLLIDCDHLSWEEGQKTGAEGWAKDIAAFDDHGKWQPAVYIKWTPPGLEKIRTGIYKFFSPEFWESNCQNMGRDSCGMDIVRPLKLDGLALTNRPNIPGCRPITNRAVQNTNPTNNKTNNTMTIDDIKARLGLTPEATDDDVLAAIDQLMTEASDAASQDAENIIEKEGLSDLPEEVKSDVIETLLENRERGLRLVEVLKNNRTSNGTPRYANPGVKRQLPSRHGDAGKETLLINKANQIQAEYRSKGKTISFWKARAMAKNSLKRESK